MLDCIFSICSSIKTWLDLNDENIAIISCPRGQHNTGILIACLLRFNKSFDSVARAYDFYCSKRLRGDHASSYLAPSYRILFENVDRVADNRGYRNSAPLHIKTLAITGLPVEDMPCVDIFDANGQVFSSHVSWKQTNICTWNADYGDGFYKVAANIIGDFTIVCRFGGEAAVQKDKSTLIFKYQNSTGFMAPAPLELKHYNIDVNPNYNESIEVGSG